MPKFNESDLFYAERAWNTYMFEINGAGIRWEFSRTTPGKIDEWLRRPYECFQPRELILNGRSRLDRRIAQLGMFVSDLERFEDREIITPGPAMPYTNAPNVVRRLITGRDIGAFRGFHGALSGYVEVATSRGLQDPATAKAVQNVAMYIYPEEWRAAGEDVPDDAGSGVVGTSVRFYLEDVVNVLTPPEEVGIDDVRYRRYLLEREWYDEAQQMNRYPMISQHYTGT